MFRSPHRSGPRRPLVKSLAAITAGLVAILGVDAALAAPAGATTTKTESKVHSKTYYVDNCSGRSSDSYAGTSSKHPWATLDKVDATTFNAGDRILFRDGCTWEGQLWPKGSGTSAAPITIGSYEGSTGDTTAPKIEGAGTVDDAVRLYNQQYWTIEDLDISNAAPATGTAGENLGDFRGIHVYGDNSQKLSGFTIDHVNVHDVTGEDRWISGSSDDDVPGIYHGNGWDLSKRTGGIVFESTVPDIADPPSTATTLNDITVTNSTITDTSFAGIVVKQYTGDASGAVATGWGTRTSATDTKFTPHTNVNFSDNYITQSGTDYGCDGIYITDVRGGTVSHNVVQAAGTSGIETYYADDITVDHNEVYGTERKADGTDYNAIDADKGTTAVTIEYNYVHDNGDGILLCQFVFGNAVVRYNVVTNSARNGMYLHSDTKAVAQVYNNTIYDSNSSTHLVYGYGTYLTSHYTLTNNAFSSPCTGAAMSDSTTLLYDHNYYSSTLTVPSTEANAVTGTPVFTDPSVSGPYGTATTGPQLDLALGFTPATGSVLIDAGTTVDSNGGVDYRGATLYNGSPDIGAIES